MSRKNVGLALVLAGGLSACTPLAAHAQTAPDVYYAVLPGRQNYPVRFVSALDAEGYAAWLSTREHRTYRLPTEQEWEKAAAWDPTISRFWTYGFQSDSMTNSKTARTRAARRSRSVIRGSGPSKPGGLSIRMNSVRAASPSI
ncbi:MAG: SUMF1/EgtB/PvdO family nonheme iron enzyme [Planctomycetota bacterium]